MKKKILSLLLALMLIFSSVPMESVFADSIVQSTVKTAGTFTIDANGIVSAYSDVTAEEIVVPETINNITVTQIAADAFDGGKYPNLKSVAVAGANVTIGSKAFGYRSGNRIDGFKVWGHAESTAKTYGNENAFTFCVLTESISELTPSRGTDNCFVGDTFFISTVITASGSEDIIWTSENDRIVSIVPYNLEIENGKWVATAQVRILAKPETGEAVCKVFASTRSGLKKELELHLLKPASEVNIGFLIYDTGLNPVTPLPGYIEDTNVYVDKGYYIAFSRDCGVDNDDNAYVSIEANTKVLVEKEGATVGGLTLYEVKQKGKCTVGVTTESGYLSKNYTVNALDPATDITMKLDNTIIEDNGGFRVIEGYNGMLSVSYTPSASTDTVEWSSDNQIVDISEDGTFRTNGFGTATITCKVKDSKFKERTLSKSFTMNISKRYNYGDMVFVDDVTSKNIITETSVAAGKTAQLNVFDPSCTDDNKRPNETISWSSSNTSIATVDANGNVTAKANTNGTVKITARANSGITKTIDVHVYVVATQIKPEANTYNIPQGQTVQIPYMMTPTNTGETVTWISDDSSSVKVLNVEKDINTAGKYNLTLEILKETSGYVNITGTSSDSRIQATIQVKGLKAIPVTNMSLIPDNYVRIETVESEQVYCVEKGKNFTITANVTPSDANDSLKWMVWNEGLDYITYSINNNLATITPKRTGDVIISCESSSGFVANIKLRIIVSATSVDILNSSGASKDILQFHVGKSTQVSAKLSSSSTDNVLWSVVSGDASGIRFSKNKSKGSEKIQITASKTGSYTIRAEAESGKFDEITINAVVATESLEFVENGKKIEALSLCVGQSTTLSLVNILPVNTSDSKFNWEETKGLLTIAAASDGKSAKITAESIGTTSIKVTGESGVSFTLSVTVLIPAESLQINAQDNPKEITINRGGGIVTLTANLTPANTNDRVTWTVDREGIISLKQIAPLYGPKQLVQIQGLEEGTVVITAETESGLRKSITVVVETIGILDCVMTVSDQTYTGKAIEAIPSSVKVGSATLRRNTDYKVIGYKNNIAAGTAVITIEGIGKYSGTKTGTFTIKPKAISSSVSIIYTNSHEFKGSNIRPAVTVKYGDVVLKNGRDYKVVYPAVSANVGNYSLKVEFMGNFSGIASKTYRVTAKSAAGFTIKDKSGKVLKTLPSKSYTSKAITQSFYVYDGTKKLLENKDYTIKYINNTNAGTATVQIYGKGNYSSATYREIKFTIKPYSLTSVKITSIPDKSYTGLEIKPSLTVKRKMPDGTYKTMYAGSDYKVTYSNNIKTGKATAKISAGSNGNYTSSKTVNFKILPKQVQGFKQSSASQSSVKLSWTKVEGSVSGYAVYKYNTSTKKYTYVSSTSGTSITVSKLSAGNSYVFAVRAYKKVGTSTKYYSPYSVNVTAYTVPKTPSATLSSASQSVTAKWGQVSGANRYYIYYSTNGGKTYKKAGNVSSASYTIRALTKGQKVYVKVKSAKTIAGKEYLSPYSQVKSITVK
ncbi:MAG: hypothetical protein HFI34_02160 [Lachnospiraceae bacterium]|nr:hypothetical protein [Lachnospiraceae bacterium]